jgi:hypothetical protein
LVKILRALVCALLTVVALVAAAPAASAAPPTATYSGSAEGDVVSLDLELAGLSLADVRLANSESTTTNPPPVAVSTARNLAAEVAGFTATVAANERTAPPDAPGAVAGSLATIDALGISSGLLTTSNAVSSLGAGNCLTEGPAAQTTTTTAGVDVAPAGVGNVLSTTESSVTTTTGLVPTDDLGFERRVESEAVGTLGDFSLFGGDVDIEVVGDATLNAFADGTTNGAEVTYTAPVVTVTFDGEETVLELDAVESTEVELGALGRVTVTLNEPTGVVEDPAGLEARASVSVITLAVELGPEAAPLGTATIDLLPLSVSAVSPAGGIDCPPPAPVITEPDDGELINDRTPTYTGTGVPGAVIELTVDGAVIEDTDIVVGEDGNWTFTQPDPLDDGDHTVSAIQTLDGTPSVPSAVNDFVVDATAPGAPVITAPEDGSTTTDDTPLVTGTGEPGATVTVVIDGEEIDDVTVDGDGNWELPLTDPLDDGEHTVNATQTDEAGNESAADEVTFAVDSEALAPVITAPADGSSTNDTTPTVEGTAEPGAEVDVEIDGTPVGTVTADEDGNWSLELTDPLDEGDHTVSAVQTDVAGNVSEAAENDFTVDLTAPAAPVITSPEDGATVDDRTPTIEGTGEPGTTIVVIVDGEPVGSVVVDEDGDWSLTLPDPLADGDHTIEAVAVDEAGNQSGSDAIEITVDAADSTDGGSGEREELADTGGPSLGFAIVGGLLLVVGGTVLSLTRRRA